MQNNNIMFISENGIVVHQEDFRQLVEKHRTDNNIEFYIRRSNEYAENFDFNIHFDLYGESQAQQAFLAMIKSHNINKNLRAGSKYFWKTFTC